MTYAKILIEGTLEVITGMHIGDSKEYSAIGAVDSPVIRDPINKLPMIPGSSLKGKLRTLLAKKYNPTLSNHNDDDEIIKRLFGGQSENKNSRSARILISDSVMEIDEEERIRKEGIDEVTEIKFENTINRLTGVANPRQIERVIRGTRFNLHMVYEMTDENETLEDLKLLKEGFDLLKYDYLGGHGTRGYGRVDLTETDISIIIGEENQELEEKLTKMWSI